MKSFHKALHLRHHKHTGRLLAHKHTSYRVLFLLLLVPIAMMALVSHLQVAASDYTVTATVPAPIPTDAPVIILPKEGAASTAAETIVSGTCPVITPAIIIAIYDNDVFAGSVVCAADGTFSVPIPLSFGTHKLVATVVTITNGIGASSQLVTITRTQPVEVVSPTPAVSSTPMTQLGESMLIPFVHIMQQGAFVFIGSDGNAVWQGSFMSGTPPYQILVDWGDNTKDTYKVSDHALQTFTHTYESPGTYKIVITAVDVNGSTTVLYSTATTLSVPLGGGTLDSPSAPVLPIWAFINQYILQIYILTLSSVVFLWYIEHGHHIVRGVRLQRHRH